MIESGRERGEIRSCYHTKHTRGCVKSVGKMGVGLASTEICTKIERDSISPDVEWRRVSSSNHKIVEHFRKGFQRLTHSYRFCFKVSVSPKSFLELSRISMSMMLGFWWLTTARCSPPGQGILASSPKSTFGFVLLTWAESGHSPGIPAQSGRRSSAFCFYCPGEAPPSLFPFTRTGRHRERERETRAVNGEGKPSQSSGNTQTVFPHYNERHQWTGWGCEHSGHQHMVKRLRRLRDLLVKGVGGYNWESLGYRIMLLMMK